MLLLGKSERIPVLIKDLVDRSQLLSLIADAVTRATVTKR